MRAQGSSGIHFEAWQDEIARAANVDQLLQAVRRYLSAWSPEALALLPSDLAAPALPDTEAIYARAYIASRAELVLKGDEPGYIPLREMALTLAAAATRLLSLEAYRAVTDVNSAGIGSGLPSGVRGRLVAEVRTKA